MLRTTALLIAMAALLPCQDDPPVADPPTDPAVALNNQAVDLHAKGKYAEAIPLLRKAIDLRKIAGKPVEDVFKRNLGRSYLGDAGQLIGKQKYRDAIERLDDARVLLPKSARVQAYYGIVFYRQNQFASARRFLEEALLLDDELAVTHEYLGFVHYKAERLQEALDAWKRAVELRPDSKNRLKTFMDKAKRELAVESRMQTISSTHFVCKYPDSQGRRVASTILDWLEDAYAEVGLRFHHYPKGRLSAVLYSDRDFSRATQTHKWVGALFDGKIRIPIRNFDAQRKNIRDTINHEYTHFVIRKLTPHCPGWLHEGLAQHAEGHRRSRVDRYIMQVRQNGKLPSLASLAQTFSKKSDPDEARLAYAVALSFTDFLIQKYHINDLERLLRKLEKKGTFEKVFYQVYRRKLEEVEKIWLDSF